MFYHIAIQREREYFRRYVSKRKALLDFLSYWREVSPKICSHKTGCITSYGFVKTRRSGLGKMHLRLKNSLATQHSFWLMLLSAARTSTEASATFPIIPCTAQVPCLAPILVETLSDPRYLDISDVPLDPTSDCVVNLPVCDCRKEGRTSTHLWHFRLYSLLTISLSDLWRSVEIRHHKKKHGIVSACRRAGLPI